jgi:uncharacterized integral membrane protein
MSEERSWLTWLREHSKVIAVCVCLLAFALFLIKNSAPTQVWIFGLQPEMPLILIAFSCFALGWLSGWIFSALYRKRKSEKNQSVV